MVFNWSKAYPGLEQCPAIVLLLCTCSLVYTLVMCLVGMALLIAPLAESGLVILDVLVRALASASTG